ncbi:hypothetical protein Y1Q_0008467 [Alligator mississippiensis]|uniref:C-type lectin domain-containing protein n=1 Tax=Alligator mississippiensis TaxID=8496 RepID=A0A151M1E4_ALLMI|nr:hypothetical protein Y1Q_0008467 [Alligator mississippiensis]
MAQKLPPHQGEKCPSRWSRMENRYYLFSPERRTWELCKSLCISQAAKLLTVETWEEQDFINHELFQYYEDRNSAVFYHRFWIGLPYDSETRKWVWVDGSALSSSLFDLPDPSHPSYQGGACVYVQAISDMSEPVITYSAVKFDPSKSQEHGNKGTVWDQTPL